MIELRHTLKICYLATCFMLVFLMYLMAQSFVTSLHPTFGFLAIALLYLAFGLFSPFAPVVGKYLGARLSLYDDCF